MKTDIDAASMMARAGVSAVMQGSEVRQTAVADVGSRALPPSNLRLAAMNACPRMRCLRRFRRAKVGTDTEASRGAVGQARGEMPAKSA